MSTPTRGPAPTFAFSAAALALAALLPSSPAGAMELTRCGRYTVQGTLAVDAPARSARITVNPKARSEYLVTLGFPAAKGERLSRFNGLPVQAEIEIRSEGQKFLVSGELLDVSFALPSGKQEPRRITFREPRPCDR